MAALFAAVALSTAALQPASAGFFDFLFPDSGQDSNQGAARKQAAPDTQPSLFPNPFQPDRPAPQPLPPFSSTQGTPAAGIRSASAHCVRMCDGRHFSIFTRGEISQNAMCRAFCPASATKVFFGQQIDRAISIDGERYSELETAYAYRKKLSPDCTCNGRDPGGLVPVDISLDTTLRPGDVVATATGLVAFNGAKAGYGLTGQAAEFTPVESYPGLSAATRARLGEMKVAPASADIPEDTTASIGDTKPRAALE